MTRVGLSLGAHFLGGMLFSWGDSVDLVRKGTQPDPSVRPEQGADEKGPEDEAGPGSPHPTVSARPSSWRPPGVGRTQEVESR